MEKIHVLETLCNLSSEVMRRVFNSRKPADCFCGQNSLSGLGNYDFDADVLEYIQTAVREKIAREGRW